MECHKPTYEELEFRIKELEDKLDSKNQSELERKYSLLAEFSNDVIWTMDFECKFTYISPSVYNLRGYTPDEVLSQTIEDVVVPYHLSKIHSKIEEVFQNNLLCDQSESDYIEIEQICKDGSMVWTETSSYLLYGESGSAEGFVGITRNISERKNSEVFTKKLVEELKEESILFEESLFNQNNLIEELEENKSKLEVINSEKDKFFSIIAHDLKSPFSGFLGISKIIAENMQDLTMSEIQELAQNMKDSATNLYQLLDNLLEWSRMQRNVIIFEPELNNLKLLVKNNFNIVNDNARQKNIELINDVPIDIEIYADLPMINTIFRNLISNAIKFSKRGGIINIFAHDSDSDIKISVKDQGIGISQEMINNLFQIDKKVSRPGTEGEPSTGLGLVLCREFVEKHNGKIWIESEIDVGTTFWFSLPKD